MAPEPEAAVAIVHARTPEESILLIRRTERENDAWSGHWSLPGGRREAQDRDLLDTALRELEEECGIRLARDQMERALPTAVARRGTGRYLPVAPFVFRAESHLQTILDPDEAVEAFWIPLHTLLDPARHVLRPVPGRPTNMLYPGIELRCVPLWGFTYRLLGDWLDLTPRAESGPEAARLVLQFLLSRGLELEHDWNGRKARVSGAIPACDLLAYFSKPEHFHPAVNCLEATPSHVRIFGPRFEDYLIDSR
jgi:8-oxo-dGTP pyrophosphatase MutT (NUDIX family)